LYCIIVFILYIAMSHGHDTDQVIGVCQQSSLIDLSHSIVLVFENPTLQCWIFKDKYNSVWETEPVEVSDWHFLTLTVGVAWITIDN
jgi:hypothetical protein